MTKEELKNRIENYLDCECGGNDSYTAMREISWEMFKTLNLRGVEFKMIAEDGSVWTGSALDMAELIHCNYSECEWVAFMWQAEKEHGTYEINPWGNDIVTIIW